MSCFRGTATYSIRFYQKHISSNQLRIFKICNVNIFFKRNPHQLLNGKYSFPDDNFMLWRKKKKTNFTVSSRKEIIREMKVDNFETNLEHNC